MTTKFPGWRFKGSDRRLIHTPEEEAALGEGWSESPVPTDEHARQAFDSAPPAPEPDFIAPLAKFPGWRFHKDGASRIVHSQAEHDALGGDWSEAPTHPEPVTVRTVVTTTERVTDISGQVAGLPGQPHTTVEQDHVAPVVHLDNLSQEVVTGVGAQDLEQADEKNADTKPTKRAASSKK